MYDNLAERLFRSIYRTIEVRELPTPETKTQSLTDELFWTLHGKIQSGEMPPGSRFPTQKEIAETAKVSRTVVREAVARLAAQGLTVSRQGSGVYVAQTAHYQAFQITRDELADVEDVIKLLEIRLAVETEMAGLAAERRTVEDLAEIRTCLQRMVDSEDAESAAVADSDFHVAIARATKNTYFERFMAFLGVRLVPPRTLSLQNRTPEENQLAAERVLREHEGIIAAIEARDAEAARAAIRAHIQESLNRHAKVNASRKRTEPPVR